MAKPTGCPDQTGATGTRSTTDSWPAAVAVATTAATATASATERLPAGPAGRDCGPLDRRSEPPAAALCAR